MFAVRHRACPPSLNFSLLVDFFSTNSLMDSAQNGLRQRQFWCCYKLYATSVFSNKRSECVSVCMVVFVLLCEKGWQSSRCLTIVNCCMMWFSTLEKVTWPCDKYWQQQATQPNLMHAEVHCASFNEHLDRKPKNTFCVRYWFTQVMFDFSGCLWIHKFCFISFQTSLDGRHSAVLLLHAFSHAHSFISHASKLKHWCYLANSKDQMERRYTIIKSIMWWDQPLPFIFGCYRKHKDNNMMPMANMAQLVCDGSLNNTGAYRVAPFQPQMYKNQHQPNTSQENFETNYIL